MCVLLLTGCSDSDDITQPTAPDPPPKIDQERSSVAAYHYAWHDFGFSQLLMDRTLRFVRIGEDPPRLYTTRVTIADFHRILELTFDENLVEFFESRAECEGPFPTDGGSSILVNTENLEGASPLCTPEMAALHRALLELGDTYFPKR
jgi:hypothetical protein